MNGYHRDLHIRQLRILSSLTAFGNFRLILGFSYEEEFVILSLAAGGVNLLLLMIVYALSVSVALISVTNFIS